MRIYQAIGKQSNDTCTQKQDSFYWGDPNEIKLAISKSSLEANTTFTEKVHTHTNSFTYFIVITGSGFIEVEGSEIRIKQNEILEIRPGEKYRVLRSGHEKFSWIVVGTLPGNKDKIIY